MSGGPACTCEVSKLPITERFEWVVRQRNGNASAFNGYRWAQSDSSLVQCLRCRTSWRTKAAYVRRLRDIV